MDQVLTMTNVFDELIALPGLRRLFDLAWRTFGVNPALVSMDGRRVVLFDPEARAQPFCRALNTLPGGRELCAMCDRSKFFEARRIARKSSSETREPAWWTWATVCWRSSFTRR